jgi:hypothetical protein
MDIVTLVIRIIKYLRRQARFLSIQCYKYRRMSLQYSYTEHWNHMDLDRIRWYLKYDQNMRGLVINKEKTILSLSYTDCTHGHIITRIQEHDSALG